MWRFFFFFRDYKFQFNCYIAGVFPATARPFNCFPPNATSGQHCESFDVKRETVHCYPVNSSLQPRSPAVARDGWPESQRGFQILLCYITNHLMTGPLGNSEFCFPRISMFPSASSRDTLGFSGNKIHCSPRDQSLSVKYQAFDNKLSRISKQDVMYCTNCLLR